jgi:hypothetical protein
MDGEEQPPGAKRTLPLWVRIIFGFLSVGSAFLAFSVFLAQLSLVGIAIATGAASAWSWWQLRLAQQADLHASRAVRTARRRRATTHRIMAAVGVFSTLAVIASSALGRERLLAATVSIVFGVCWVYLVTLARTAPVGQRPSISVVAFAGLLIVDLICGTGTVISGHGNWPVRAKLSVWQQAGIDAGNSVVVSPRPGPTVTVTVPDPAPSPTHGPVPSGSTGGDPCPDGVTAQVAFTRDVPPAVGAQMFTAWAAQRHSLIGCLPPGGHPVEVGDEWFAMLVGGSQTPDAVVGNRTSAAVLFSDFESLVVPSLEHLRRISTRTRWGLGTMQAISLTNGRCELLERYEQAKPLLLPAAVTELLVARARHDGAFPWVRSVRQGLASTHYVVTMVQPARTVTGFHELRPFTVTYTSLERSAHDDSAVAVSNGSCQRALIVRTTEIGALLETTVNRAARRAGRVSQTSGASVGS